MRAPGPDGALADRWLAGDQLAVLAGGRPLALQRLFTRWAGLSPKAVEFCKSLIHNARNGVPRRAGLSLERERFMDLFDFEDQAEGVKAFLEKRKPNWKNA